MNFNILQRYILFQTVKYFLYFCNETFYTNNRYETFIFNMVIHCFIFNKSYGIRYNASRRRKNIITI